MNTDDKAGTDTLDRLLLDRLLWGRHRRRPTARTREALAARYARLVPLTVARLASRGADREDLLGAGGLGLARALDRFDPARGVQFETYAIALIRGAVRDEERGAEWAPRTAQEEGARLARARAEAEAQSGCAATPRQVAAALGTDEDALAGIEARAARRHPCALEADATGKGSWCVDAPDQPVTLADYALVADADVAAEAERGDRDAALRAALGRLPPREAHVLRAYFGISEGGISEGGSTNSGSDSGSEGAGGGEPVRAIAAGLGVSESRAHQLRDQGLARLRGMPGVLAWADS